MQVVWFACSSGKYWLKEEHEQKLNKHYSKSRKWRFDPVPELRERLGSCIAETLLFVRHVLKQIHRYACLACHWTVKDIWMGFECMLEKTRLPTLLCG